MQCPTKKANGISIFPQKAKICPERLTMTDRTSDSIL